MKGVNETMKAQINLITIWTDQINPMKNFYHNVLGFAVSNDLGNYVEFKNEGVRFAICLREVMYDYSAEYKKAASGQGFELAFPCDSPEDVDTSFNALIRNGATAIQEPQTMPWNQRTAVFADPDGNIHEIFAELE